MSRSTTLAVLAIAGVLLGLAASAVLPAGPPSLPWYGAVLAGLACAIGVPVVLGSVGTRGAYQAMTRLWSAFGAAAILLAAAGATAAVLSIGGAGRGNLPWLSLAAGAGLFAGLGLVKLSVRPAGTRPGPGPHA